jgi:hypothetical protein
MFFDTISPPPPPHSPCKRQYREELKKAEKAHFFTILSLIIFFSRLLSSIKYIKPQNRKHRLSVAETFDLYHRSCGVNKEVNYGY